MLIWITLGQFVLCCIFFCTSFISLWPLWVGRKRCWKLLSVQPRYPHQSYLEKILFGKSSQKKKREAVFRLKPIGSFSASSYLFPAHSCQMGYAVSSFSKSWCKIVFILFTLSSNILPMYSVLGLCVTCYSIGLINHCFSLIDICVSKCEMCSSPFLLRML